MTAVVTTIKDVNPTSTNAPKRRMGPEHAEASPSQATRSSSISNEAVRTFSTHWIITTANVPGWVRDHAEEHARLIEPRFPIWWRTALQSWDGHEGLQVRKSGRWGQATGWPAQARPARAPRPLRPHAHLPARAYRGAAGGLAR